MRDSRELVFVIDDSKTARLTAAVHLKKLGCEPLELGSGAECLAELEKRQPLLILMDLNMSPMRGDECCQRIKENPAWRHIPVIIITGAENPHEVMYCWRAAAGDFLPKPISPSQLAAKVRAIQDADKRPPPGVERFAGKKILLVEDNRFYRNLVGGTLEQAGLQVLYARDGEEGLALAQEQAHSLDAILVDLVMPKLPGLELARALRRDSTLASKPVLLMSAIDEIRPGEEKEVERLTGSKVLDKRVLPIDVILGRLFATLQPALVELRASQRVPFFSVVEFSTDGGEWFSGFSYDVSAGGIFVRTLTPAPVNSPIQVRLTFPGHAHPSCSSGRVAWSNPFRRYYAYSAPVGMGIHLTEMSPELKQQIARLTAGRGG